METTSVCVADSPEAFNPLRNVMMKRSSSLLPANRRTRPLDVLLPGGSNSRYTGSCAIPLNSDQLHWAYHRASGGPSLRSASEVLLPRLRLAPGTADEFYDYEITVMHRLVKLPIPWYTISCCYLCYCKHMYMHVCVGEACLCLSRCRRTCRCF